MQKRNKYLNRNIQRGMRSRVSSGSIVSDYGLDDRAIGVRSPAGAKEFSSIPCVQTGSGAHPGSCKMGAGGPFPGVTRGQVVTLTIHPHLVPTSWMSRSYISSPPSISMACSGTALIYRKSRPHLWYTIELLSSNTNKTSPPLTPPPPNAYYFT
jgi:hypothetical protein